MRLYLARHAEALSQDLDPDCPLSEQGTEDALRVAEFLGRAGVRVSRVLHSGKKRARQTAELLTQAVAPELEPAARRGLDPNDSPDSLAEQARGWREPVLVVGHLPFLARLVARLVAGLGAGEAVAFRPGSVVCLERAEDGGWSIAWMVRPELLP